MKRETARKDLELDEAELGQVAGGQKAPDDTIDDRDRDLIPLYDRERSVGPPDRHAPNLLLDR